MHRNVYVNIYAFSSQICSSNFNLLRSTICCLHLTIIAITRIFWEPPNKGSSQYRAHKVLLIFFDFLSMPQHDKNSLWGARQSVSAQWIRFKSQLLCCDFKSLTELPTCVSVCWLERIAQLDVRAKIEWRQAQYTRQIVEIDRKEFLITLRRFTAKKLFANSEREQINWSMTPFSTYIKAHIECHRWN